MENKRLIELIKKTQKWFYDRNLQTQNPDKQFLKLFEEIGELASGLAKKQDDVVKDSIGDIAVVLIGLTLQLGIDTKEVFPHTESVPSTNSNKEEDHFILLLDQSVAAYFSRQNYQLKNVAFELIRISKFLNIDFTECLGLAYEEIKDRTGRLVDGVWVKEEDL